MPGASGIPGTGFGALSVISPLAQMILGPALAADLKGKVPQAPESRIVAPRGQPRSGDPRFRPFNVAPGAASTLGIGQWPGQPGPDFVAQQALGDVARDLRVQEERRGLEEQALAGVQKTNAQSMADLKKFGRAPLSEALSRSYGEQAEGRRGLREAGFAADSALKQNLKALDTAVGDVKTEYRQALAELNSAKAMFKLEAEENVAALALETVVGMNARGRAEYDDAVAGLRAQGIPETMVQSVGFQIRSQNAESIGNEVNEVRIRRQNEIEDRLLSYDTNISHFQSVFANAFPQLRAAVAAETVDAFTAWSGQKEGIAEVNATLNRDYFALRGTIANNMAVLEGTIRQSEMAGAALEAEIMRSMTIPMFQLAPIADAQMAYFNGAAQQDYLNEQTQFAMEAGLDAFALQSITGGLKDMAMFAFQNDQLESQERIAERQMNYGLGSAAIGGVTTGLAGFFGGGGGGGGGGIAPAPAPAPGGGGGNFGFSGF